MARNSQETKIVSHDLLVSIWPAGFLFKRGSCPVPKMPPRVAFCHLTFVIPPPQCHVDARGARSQIFAAPPLPADFRPVHHFRPPVAVSHVTGVSAALAEALRSSKGQAAPPQDAAAAGRHRMASDQRGALLGEAALPGGKRHEPCRRLPLPCGRGKASHCAYGANVSHPMRSLPSPRQAPPP